VKGGSTSGNASPLIHAIITQQVKTHHKNIFTCQKEQKTTPTLANERHVQLPQNTPHPIAPSSPRHSSRKSSKSKIPATTPPKKMNTLLTLAHTNLADTNAAYNEATQIARAATMEGNGAVLRDYYTFEEYIARRGNFIHKLPDYKYL
jgi:hypothetical protein